MRGTMERNEKRKKPFQNLSTGSTKLSLEPLKRLLLQRAQA